MQFMQLVTANAREVGGAALMGFGWQLGRDAYRNIGNIIGFLIAILLGLGGFVLPFMAGRRITQWHPIGRARYVFRVLLTWAILGSLGLVLLFGVMVLIAALAIKGPRPDAEYYAAARMLTLIFGVGSVLLGGIVGLLDRSKRKRAFQVLVDNQNFLNVHGIRDLDGGNVTHVDGMGNHLQLEHTGRDLIVFKAVGTRRKRAIIAVGQDGRFLSYSGLVEA